MYLVCNIQIISAGSHPQAYKVYNEGDGHLTVEKCGGGAIGPSVVYLKRLHCTHRVQTANLFCDW